MSVFKTKPCEIDAFRWNGDSEGLFAWADSVSNGNGTCIYYYNVNGKSDLSIKTLEGVVKVLLGDWVICGLIGEFYPCKPDAFELKYEPVS